MDPAIEQHFTDELKADPVVSQFYEKGDYKDMPSVLKGLAHAQHRLGSVLPLPNGETKPEDIAKWRNENLPRLIERKLIDAPRQLPEKYEIKKPEGLPEGAWSEQLEAKAHEWAKKHGLSQEALNDALGLHLETIGSFGQAVQTDRKASAEKIKAQLDKDGVTVEQFDAALARFRDDPVNGWDEATRELLSKSGWADHPGLNLAIYKIVKDSGQFDVRNDGGATVDEATAQSAKAEIDAIRNDKNNPKHEKYVKGDPETLKYMDSLYAKLTGGR